MKTLAEITASLVFALALWLAAAPGKAGDDNKTFLPPDVYKELVLRENKILHENLKGTPSADQLARAKVAAVMVVRFSLDTGKGDARVAQRALAIARLLGDKDKIAEARKLADADPPAGGKLEPFDARPLVGDAVDAMNHLRPKKKGGDGMHPDLQTTGPLKNLNSIEEKFHTLAKKKLTPTALGKSAKEMVLLGYRTAVLAEVVNDLAPAQKTKQWRDFAMQMRASAISLAHASEKKDADGIFKAGTSLDASCNNCHAVFK
jgi:hypothetical protein